MARLYVGGVFVKELPNDEWYSTHSRMKSGIYDARLYQTDAFVLTDDYRWFMASIVWGLGLVDAPGDTLEVTFACFKKEDERYTRLVPKPVQLSEMLISN